MRVLICGDRNWDDARVVARVLGGLLDEAVLNFDDLTVIEGCARGADSFACHWFDGPCDKGHAAHDDVRHAHYAADWNRYGKGAGPIRNQQMLDDGKPDLVFAFHDDIKASKGTRDMCERATKVGVPVYVIGRYQLDVRQLDLAGHFPGAMADTGTGGVL